MKDEIDSLLAYFKLTYGEALRKSLNLTDYDFSNYMKIASISDTFIANDFEKRDLSNLGVNLTQFNETMKYINSLSWKAFDNSTDMSKLTMTPILKTITTQMSAHIAGSTSAPKAIIYSGHDTTILLMLNFLKKSLNLDYNFTNIVFASNIFIELNKNDNGTYSVRVLHNDNEIYNGNFDNFNSGVVSFQMSDAGINDFCNPNNGVNVLYFLIAAIVLFVLCVVLIVVLCFQCAKKNNRTGTEALMTTI